MCLVTRRVSRGCSALSLSLSTHPGALTFALRRATAWMAPSETTGTCALDAFAAILRGEDVGLALTLITSSTTVANTGELGVDAAVSFTLSLLPVAS